LNQIPDTQSLPILLFIPAPSTFLVVIVIFIYLSFKFIRKQKANFFFYLVFVFKTLHAIAIKTIDNNDEMN